MTTLDSDLNKTIAAAVNAKIEASVMEALSGDEVIARFVTAALNQPVNRDLYYDRSKPKTFLANTVLNAIQQATQEAVKAFVDAEKETIAAEVRKQLRKQIPDIAERLVQGLRGSAYAVTVHLKDEER